MGKLLDRNLKGIGRLQKPFGTDDPATITAIKVMVSELYKTGQWKYLEAVRDNRTTLLALYARWSTQDLRRAMTVEGTMPYATTAMAWLRGYDGVADRGKANYEYFLKQPLKVESEFAVSDLPRVLKAYRARCLRAGNARQFNAVKNCVRAFLRDSFDRHNPIYEAVASIRNLPESPQRREKAWRVLQVIEVMDRLRPDVAAQFWTMCLTGAGMEEYRQGLEVEATGLCVRIKGRKMARMDDRRDRLVPLVEAPAPMVVMDKRLRSHLKAASQASMLPYDARSTFSLWCQEAGIPMSRVRRYMGHAPADTTERYLTTEFENFLQEDGEKLRQYLKSQKARKLNPTFSKFFTLKASSPSAA